MKRVLLVTGHYMESKRQAGFHWLAEAYWRAGWQAVFFTAPVSWLSWLRGDYRFEYPVRREANRLRWVRDRLGSYVWFTPWHPGDLRSAWLNGMARRMFRRYGRMPLGQGEQLVASADLIIFESTPGQLLFERFKAINPHARYVYRVSDDLRVVCGQPVVLEAEQRNAPKYDLLSAPSPYIYRRFKNLPNARLHYHGIPKGLFERDCASPYGSDWEVNVVFAGNTLFDLDFLDRASKLFPQWGFHIIGDIRKLPRRRNVLRHGEMPFAELVPFIKHADVGLHTLVHKVGAESFTDSLKVLQYTYCRLPIVMPEFIRSDRPNAFYYTPGVDQTIGQALLAAQKMDRSSIPADEVRSSDELARILAGQGDQGDSGAPGSASQVVSGHLAGSFGQYSADDIRCAVPSELAGSDDAAP